MKEKTSENVLAQLRARLRSGELSRVPSTRQLALETGYHRNTCAKILAKLRMEGLISVNVGAASTICGAKKNPVDDAIDYLLSQGMNFDAAKKAILESLQKRRGIFIKSPNEDLIRFELDGFTFNPGGLIISDQPQDCEFLLQLSDIRQISKKIKSQSQKTVGAIGIVSRSEAFRSHVFGALDYDGEVMSVEPNVRLVSSVFAFCNQVVCDYLIAHKLNQFAIEYKREQSKTIILTPAPYLNAKTIDELRGKLINA